MKKIIQNISKRRIIVLILCGSIQLSTTCLAQNARPAYKNAALPIDARVKDLLERMTLEEKIAQMRHIHSEHFDKNKQVDFTQLSNSKTPLSYGCVEALPYSSEEYAKAIYDLQQYMNKNTRLGIPVIPIIEGLHGVVQDGATIYPQSIGLAATFNPDLVFNMSDEIGGLVKRMG